MNAWDTQVITPESLQLSGTAHGCSKSSEMDVDTRQERRHGIGKS